ncbi:MAG: phosphopentomutase [Lachnospiraceae bacterium]|nr:phosphopentomutase [Lachnospiraceae bacterium]
MKINRIFLIVLDSMGIGEMPDADNYGDKGSNTLRAISQSTKFNIPTLQRLGIGCIDGIDYLEKPSSPTAAVARMTEASKGKDTTIGHWEISGVVSNSPLPTYPDGFPDEIISEFEKQTGRKVLCNKPYSGTEVIKDFGKQHVESGDLIVYTSGDSVFQIAAHEDVVPVQTLYDYCKIARNILTGKHSVGRVIARPFTGKNGNYTRTSNRHDFSLKPPRKTMLNYLCKSGFDVISVGKINDIFAGSGITEKYSTKNNSDGMAVADKLLDKNFNGLCFINLVDFDMLYGHRNDIDGYANALSKFDAWLNSFISKMHSNDLVMITADHGCDPSTKSTDHSREYTPLIMYGENITPTNLGTRNSFSDIAATILDIFGVKESTEGKSFANKIISCKNTSDAELLNIAKEAAKNSYSPYSKFKVGAALLCDDGSVFSGCNVENASFGATNCAESTAVFSAVANGKQRFTAIAVAGTKDGIVFNNITPCGICRQVLNEFCNDDFRVILPQNDNIKVLPFSELLPNAFDKF